MPKWYDQLVENFGVYLEAKIHFDSSRTFFPKIWAKWIFLEKRVLSLFKYSNYLLSCKKLEKTNSRFLRKILNRRTDRQTGNQTDRQEDRQRDRRPNGQTDNSDFIGPCEKQGSKKSERQKYKTKFKTDVRQDPNNCV